MEYGENNDIVADLRGKLEQAKEAAKAAANKMSPSEKRRQIEGALGRCEAALAKCHQEYELTKADIAGWSERIEAAEKRLTEVHDKGVELDKEKTRLEK